MLGDAGCVQCGELTIGSSMLRAGLVPIYHSLVHVLEGLQVCKPASFPRRLKRKMCFASIPGALMGIWSQGEAEPILKKSPERQEVWVPGLQHPASCFSDLHFLLVQALVLFRGWVEDVSLAVILQQRLELGTDVVLSVEGHSLPLYMCPGTTWSGHGGSGRSGCSCPPLTPLKRSVKGRGWGWD